MSTASFSFRALLPRRVLGAANKSIVWTLVLSQQSEGLRSEADRFLGEVRVG